MFSRPILPLIYAGVNLPHPHTMKYEGETAYIMSIAGEGKGLEAEELKEALPARSRAKGCTFSSPSEPASSSKRLPGTSRGRVDLRRSQYSTRSTIKPLTSMTIRWSHPGDTSVLTIGGKCKNTYHGSCHQGGIRLTDKENE